MVAYMLVKLYFEHIRSTFSIFIQTWMFFFAWSYSSLPSHEFHPFNSFKTYSLLTEILFLCALRKSSSKNFIQLSRNYNFIEHNGFGYAKQTKWMQSLQSNQKNILSRHKFKKKRLLRFSSSAEYIRFVCLFR